MKLNATFLFMFVFVLATLTALAQTGVLPDAPQPQNPASTDVQLAPAPTVPATGTSSIETSSINAPSTRPPNQSAQPPAENNLVSQAAPFPRYRGPIPPPRGYGYPSAFAPSRPPLSPVGALIGFGAGAALGASASGDQTARGRVAGGLIGGAIGALIGGAIGTAFAVGGRSFHHWDDAQQRKHNKPAPRPIEPDVDASLAPAQAASAGSL
jgi:hypothetical protein